MASNSEEIAEMSKRMEEYLEALYLLYINKRIIRLKDLAERLNVKPASIVGYLEKLSQGGYVDYRKREYIKLTEKGFRAARKIYKRHIIIRKFLETLLDIPGELADEDACYIEHGLNQFTIERIILFMDFCYKDKDNLKTT